MIEMTLRLARLRQLAKTATTPDYGRERIAHLLEQELESPDVTCPRYAGIAENCGDRMIAAADDPGALVEELCDLALAEVSHQPEAIIDLDTGVRHEAARAMTLRFRPELPGARERVVALPSGTRSAVRLLLNVAEENSEDNEALVEAIEIGDEIVKRLSP